MNAINLGCGDRYVVGWKNLDFVARPPHVVGCDLTKGIPFPDGTFDVAYHSHVLEHFSRADGLAFLKECARVLKPGGVIRVAVPDLEGIARNYLRCLDACRGGAANAADYDWMLLELYDQVQRERPGGEMAAALAKKDLANRDFVLSRIGSEAIPLMAAADAPADHKPARPSFFRRMKLGIAGPIVRALTGATLDDIRSVRFRKSGEIHKCMYDEFSLSRALRAAGMTEIVRRGAKESYVAGWDEFHLDTEADGRVRKPDSLFVEGKRPLA